MLSNQTKTLMEVSNMIISLINSKINIENEHFCEIDKDYLDNIYKYGLFSNKFKEYKIIFGYKEYTLKCPIILDGNSQRIALVPSLKIPRKKYPTYVYLYAVALYLSSKISMRNICKEVKRIFGLESFSHSTLSRTIKKLANNISIISSCCIQYTNSMSSALLVQRKRWDHSFVKIATSLLNCLNPIMKIADKFSAQLSYDFFNFSGGNFLF